jgi:hypothetical protein
MTTAHLHESETGQTAYVGTRPIPFATGSVAGSANLTLFRRLARTLCHGPRIQRAARRQSVVRILREAGEPQRYIGELLDVCVHEGGPDGLDLAIDVLSETGSLTADYVFRFLQRDFSNWQTGLKGSRSSDDVWYALARALAKADLDEKNVKLPLLALGLTAGTPSIREATVHALGDLGGASAKKLLERAVQDPDRLVRESAGEVLADLET